MLKHAHVEYRGEVQGVGFRYTARSLAHSYAIVGAVKNMSDGSVEIEAEGEEREILDFLKALEQRLGGHVVERTLRWGEATGEWQGFTIAH